MPTFFPWVNLEGIMLSEISHAQKTDTTQSHLHKESEILKLTAAESRLGVTRCCGAGHGGGVGQRQRLTDARPPSLAVLLT